MPFAFGTLSLFRPLRPVGDDRRPGARPDQQAVGAGNGAGPCNAGVVSQREQG